MTENKPIKNNEVPTSADINRQMMEIKKKIQLSEGQRKAAFEDCEAERKQNYEEIQKLKTEITEMTKQLYTINLTNNPATSSTTTSLNQIESLIGPTTNKTPDQIHHLLDLQIIDKSKMLDLITYKHKKRQHHLKLLAKQYQNLISEKNAKQIVEKLERPLSKAKNDLQNSIHAVKVQLREANHISERYQEIRKLLQDDSARFESKTKRIEDELQCQNREIDQLQRVMREAQEMRGLARNHLLKEEKLVMSLANSREKQAVEGKRLVNSRKQELEMLEKRMFQGVNNKPTTQSDTGEDLLTATGGDEDSSATPLQQQQPHQTLSEAFDILKQATGATSTEQVLERFSSQKDTFLRLISLRKKSELEKKQLEKELEGLNVKLEHFKFAEVKETERKSSRMEQLEYEINEEKKRSEDVNQIRVNKMNVMEAILKELRELHVCVNPLMRPLMTSGVGVVLAEIKTDLGSILERISCSDNNNERNGVDGEEEKVEEKWLPGPYSGLVRRTPLPVVQGAGGGSPVGVGEQGGGGGGAGSEDEEDVPSRTYLKRQAQLVVDAKSRRKNIRLRN